MSRGTKTRRADRYELTPEEAEAIREGLAELDRGEWIGEEAMKAFWVRCGVIRAGEQ